MLESIMSTILTTGILGIVIWRMKTQIMKKEQMRDEAFLLLLQANHASMKLAKSTAEAVQLNKCNGNVHAALAEAERIEKEYQQFYVKMSAQIMKGA